MIRREVAIKNPTGLHLRPAGIFCNTASYYKCSVVGACIKSGDVIKLICEGEDEEEAMEAMIKAIDDGLGE